MATTAAFPTGPPAANRRIFEILQGSTKIPQELRRALEPAAEAFHAKSFKTAAKYYITALESIPPMNQKHQSQITVLIKYMLCMCWIESTDAKDLLESLRNLEELERAHGLQYPMLYYAVGKAYFKLYRFNKAEMIIKKGFSVLNHCKSVIEYKIPGTEVVIPESSKERLVAALANLNDQCSSWHRPDAVCCMPDCSSHSQNEGADKNIFFGSPIFTGMVQVSCNNTSNFCTMNFHLACWKAKKEELCSLRKMSDKEVLNCECFTPNCENQGVRCTIKKIEIYDENAEIKASIEPRVEDVVRHAKPNPQPKGAIRKQQPQVPKAKSTETRAAPFERPARPHFVPNNPTNHNNSLTRRVKVEKEENEEEDDINEEQALKASIEKLAQLRENNFNIKDDAMWRPDLPMYGNQYMLATADVMPDPDFMDEGVEGSDLKAFIFSYFHSSIAENGPMKLDDLYKQWEETIVSLNHINADLVLKHYADISEFLLQSVKFARVGDYICVADRLDEAYEFAKAEIYCVGKDIDQCSNNSDIDAEEALFNDYLNQEKNNNSLPYFSVLGDDKPVAEEYGVSDKPTYKDIRYDEKSFMEPADTANGAPDPPAVESTVVTEVKVPAQKASVSSSELAAAKDSNGDGTSRKSQKRPHSAEGANVSVATETAQPRDKKNREVTTSRADKSHERVESAVSAVIQDLDDAEVTKIIERRLKKLRLAAGKVTMESKSTDEPRSSDVTDSHDISMHHSGKTANQATDKNKRQALMNSNKGQLSSPLTNGVKVSDYTSNSSSNQPRTEDPELSTLGALIGELHNLNAGFEEYKEKTRLLQAQIAALEKARTLHSAVVSKYTNHHTEIVRKIEECRMNSEVCAGIQSVLMSTIGQKLPNYGAEWLEVIKKLEEIDRNLQLQYDKIIHKLYTMEDPEKLEEVNLPPLPQMPETTLTNVIEEAFDIHQTYQVKEFQRMLAAFVPPAATTAQTPAPTQTPASQSTPMTRPPPNQAQPPPLFSYAQYPSSVAGYYEGHQLVQGNRANRTTLGNHVRFGQLPNFLSSQPAILNSAEMGVNNRFPGFIPPPGPQFFSGPFPTALSYQQIPSAQEQIFNMSQIPPPPLQQQELLRNESHQYALKKAMVTIPSVHQMASSAQQNVPTPNFIVPEPSKPSLRPSSPLPAPRSLPSGVQLNGETEQSVPSRARSQSQAENSVANLARSQSVAELETRTTSVQSTAKLHQAASVSTSELPTSSQVLERSLRQFPTSSQVLESSTRQLPIFSTMPERSSTPVKKKAPLVALEQNTELSGVKFSQRANSVSEIPMSFMAQQLPSVDKENVEGTTNPLAGKQKPGPGDVADKGGAKKVRENWNNSAVQESPVFKGVANVRNHKDVVVDVAMDFQNHESFNQAEALPKPVEKISKREAKPRKKTERSMDKVMRKMREHYKGVLELDLLKGIECVRKKHNNSLSNLPIKRIIREADRFILDRQQKQLCGYEKRPPSQYFAVSNPKCPWGPPEGDRKRQSSFSSTSSAGSLKRDTMYSSSFKKQWEQVVTPNETWQSETPESDCVICLESMIGTPSYSLKCKHTFHKFCIKNWYQQNQSCPTCRVHSTIDEEYPPLPMG